MGVYTTIIHPQDGRELQIKTGDDLCDVYHVGDAVLWSFRKDRAGWGTLLDGAYASYSDHGPDDWVVIKDHRVHAVVPQGQDVYEASLMQQYDIPFEDHELWSDEDWEKVYRRRAERKAAARAFDESIKHLPPKKQMALKLIRPLMGRRFAHLDQILKVTPLGDK
jgi:hypothetical protein